jgi:hypothetical protein
MATKTKTSPKAKKRDLKSEIIEKYKEHMLMEGRTPASIYAFCKELEIEEGEFYQYFNNFGQVASAFWTHLFHENLKRLQATAEFEEFSVREKLLSFYFSFFESVKKHRSYALLSFSKGMFSLKKESFDLTQLKKDFKHWINQLMIEGKTRDEIAGRSKFNDIYDDLFWYQFMFLMDFWRKDGSTGFEKTDEAIEKSVNLSFDLIEKNALDSAFDFGKFIFQNR